MRAPYRGYNHDQERFADLAKTATPYERVCSAEELRAERVDPALQAGESRLEHVFLASAGKINS